QRAMTVLERLVGQKTCQKMAKVTIRDWGIRVNEPIACAVTLRGEKAIEFVKKTLEVVGNKLPKSSFDVNGNFSFGIKEHIEISGVRYEPSLGIFGMDICVAMEKPGYHVKRRRILRAHIGKKQKLTPEEGIAYVEETFGIEILESVKE
ncbi:MAG: 50S ribosomal protein L5, partial [Candidatus Bathyarchaeota archaeon]